MERITACIGEQEIFYGDAVNFFHDTSNPSDVAILVSKRPAWQTKLLDFDSQFHDPRYKKPRRGSSSSSCSSYSSSHEPQKTKRKDKHKNDKRGKKNKKDKERKGKIHKREKRR